MKFQDYLDAYQKLVDKKLRETLYPDEVDAFLRELEITITVYAQVTDHFKYQHRKWDSETLELCSLREASKLKEKS